MQIFCLAGSCITSRGYTAPLFLRIDRAEKYMLNGENVGNSCGYVKQPVVDTVIVPSPNLS